MGLIVAGLCGCESLTAPETGARAAPAALAAAYPPLLTEAQIARLAAEGGRVEETAEEQAALADRVARLRARARALGPSALTPEERALLQQAGG